MAINLPTGTGQVSTFIFFVQYPPLHYRRKIGQYWRVWLMKIICKRTKPTIMACIWGPSNEQMAWSDSSSPWVLIIFYPSLYFPINYSYFHNCPCKKKKKKKKHFFPCLILVEQDPFLAISFNHSLSQLPKLPTIQSHPLLVFLELAMNHFHLDLKLFLFFLFFLLTSSNRIC